VKIKAFVPILRQSFSDWNDDNAPRLGAALAFYTILSISPLVVLVIAIVSLVSIAPVRRLTSWIRFNP